MRISKQGTSYTRLSKMTIFQKTKHVLLIINQIWFTIFSTLENKGIKSKLLFASFSLKANQILVKLIKRRRARKNKVAYQRRIKSQNKTS